MPMEIDDVILTPLFGSNVDTFHPFVGIPRRESRLKNALFVIVTTAVLATHFLSMVKLAMIQRCMRILNPSDRT